MRAVCCERYRCLAAKQLKLTTGAAAAAAALFLCLTPALWGIRHLGPEEAARVLERFVALIGIILFTPLFAPEQTRAVREAVRARWTPSAAAPLLRLALGTAALAALCGAMVAAMRWGGCVFDPLRYWLGTCATALALGSVGAAGASLCDNAVAGYMAALAYYLLNLFGARLGPFGLFTAAMETGAKLFLFAFSGALFALAVGYRALRR